MIFGQVCFLYFGNTQTVANELAVDTNDIVVLYPQTTIDNGTYPTWSGNLSNPNACFDWIGQYGESDWKSGDHMKAIVNMVEAVIGQQTEPDPLKTFYHPFSPFGEEL